MQRTGLTKDYLAYAEAAQRFCGPNPVILDIGANIGVTALAFSRIPGAQVEAFEPASGTFGYLARNIKNNGVATVRAHNIGVSDSACRLPIGSDSADSRHIMVQDSASGGHMEEADFETLDGLTERLGLTRVDYIKMDVEGHEDRVLAGAVNTLKTHRPALQLEIVKDSKFADRSPLFQFVREYAAREECAVYQVYKTVIEVPDLEQFLAQDVIQNDIVLVPRKTES